MRAEPALVGFKVEVLWTVYCMMEVLQGHADSICMEPLDYTSSDLKLTYGDKTHYYEIKLNLPWLLFVKKYTENLFNFLNNQRKGEIYCTIVYLYPIEYLSELISLAKNTNGYDDFNQAILQNGLQQEHFRQLLPQLEKPEEIYQTLKHLNFKTIGDHLDKSTESRIELLIDGDPERAKLVLIDYACKTAGSELTADDIWLYLETTGFHPRRLAESRIRRKRLVVSPL